MSCRCRWIDSASVRDLIAHGYSLIDRKPAVGVGATWRFAGTPLNLAASTHARASTEVRKTAGRLPEGDKGGALRSLLIESDFPVDATNPRAERRIAEERAPTNRSFWTRSQAGSSRRPFSWGMNSCRSVALRMPSFSKSCGRYVSTGFGPVSSAVGMFEPCTNDAPDLSRGRWYTRRCWNGRSRQLSKCVRCKNYRKSDGRHKGDARESKLI